MAEKIPFVQVDASSAPALDGVADEESLTGTEVGLLVFGKDGTNAAQVLKTAADGAVAVTDNAGSLTVDDGGGSLTVDGTVTISNFPATQPVSGTVAVSNLPATQPVSAAALPLPTGAATAAKQPALGTSGSPSSDVLTVQGSATMTALKVDGTVSVSNLPATQPVSATALPLPTGASTSALQSTGNTSLGNIDTKTPALVSGRVPVDGSAVTQPVSDGGGSLTVDGSVSVSNFPGTQTVSGSVSVSNFPATQPVSASSLPLPTGAATEATTNTILKEATFTGRINTQGQKTSALSTPVVIASDQSSLRVVAPADTVVSGTITATGQSVIANVAGMQTCVVEVVDFFSGTLHFQASLDSATYYSIAGTSLEGSGSVVSTLSNGVWRFACGGVASFRVLSTGFLGSTGVVIRSSAVASAWVPTMRTPGQVLSTDAALVVASARPASAGTLNVSTSTTSVELLQANTLRRGAMVVNDAASVLYLKFGTTASSTSYTVALAPAVGGVPSYYEVHKDYTGRIDGVLASGTGTARITTLS